MSSTVESEEQLLASLDTFTKKFNEAARPDLDAPRRDFVSSPLTEASVVAAEPRVPEVASVAMLAM